MSKEAVISHEFVGDGITAVIMRNLTALSATSIAVAVIGFDANY
jgi:hypothetical protein